MSAKELLSSNNAIEIFKAGWDARTEDLINKGELSVSRHEDETMELSFKKYKRATLLHQYQILSFQMMVLGQPLDVFIEIV